MPAFVRAAGRSTSGFGSVRPPALCPYPSSAKNLPPPLFSTTARRHQPRRSNSVLVTFRASGGEREGPQPSSPTRATSTKPPSIAPSPRPLPAHPAASTSREHPPTMSTTRGIAFAVMCLAVLAVLANTALVMRRERDPRLPLVVTTALVTTGDPPPNSSGHHSSGFSHENGVEG